MPRERLRSASPTPALVPCDDPDVKRSTAITRVGDLIEGLDRAAAWPDTTMVAAFVFGALLATDQHVERVELAFVVDEPGRRGAVDVASFAPRGTCRCAAVHEAAVVVVMASRRMAGVEPLDQSSRSRVANAENLAQPLPSSQSVRVPSRGTALGALVVLTFCLATVACSDDDSSTPESPDSPSSASTDSGALPTFSYARVGPAHGYALSAELRRRSGGLLAIVEGSLYPALHRLEAAGLVASSTEEIDGRHRRRYELTADGKAALKEEMRSWELFKTCVDDVLRAIP
jgi:PadR family transcriptional regulator PadR